MKETYKIIFDLRALTEEVNGIVPPQASAPDNAPQSKRSDFGSGLAVGMTVGSRSTKQLTSTVFKDKIVEKVPANMQSKLAGYETTLKRYVVEIKEKNKLLWDYYLDAADARKNTALIRKEKKELGEDYQKLYETKTKIIKSTEVQLNELKEDYTSMVDRLVSKIKVAEQKASNFQKAHKLISISVAERGNRILQLKDEIKGLYTRQDINKERYDRLANMETKRFEDHKKYVKFAEAKFANYENKIRGFIGNIQTQVALKQNAYKKIHMLEQRLGFAKGYSWSPEGKMQNEFAKFKIPGLENYKPIIEEKRIGITYPAFDTLLTQQRIGH